MPYKAKLIVGSTYRVGNVTFQKGKEVAIDKETHDYLEKNPSFEVSSGQPQTSDLGDQVPKDEKYTEAYLKKLNKEEQLRVLRDLSAEHDRFEELTEPKNEEERIAQIMDLQGE